MMVSLLPL